VQVRSTPFRSPEGRGQITATGTPAAPRSGRNTIPSRRYCLAVLSGVFPTQRPVAIAANQSSTSLGAVSVRFE
jgi:hypothetical protein